MSFGHRQRLLASGVLLAVAATIYCLTRPAERSPAAQMSLPASTRSTAQTTNIPSEERAHFPHEPRAETSGPTETASARAFAAALSRALAQNAIDPEEREAQISSALTAWAREDFDGASAWAGATTVLPRAKAVAAVVNGAAATDAYRAIHYVEALSAADAEHVAEYGSDLIFALGQVGKAAAAAQWAEENKIVNLDWLTGAFERWGAVEPEAALLHAVAMTDPVRRRAAVDAAISGWSKTEPKSLADYAAQFPDGPEKNLAVVAALRAWADVDSKATADWMLAHRSAIANVPNLATINED